MRIIDTPSKHHSPRNGQKITALVHHHTAGKDSLQYLVKNPLQVSAHYLVQKDGTIHRMVDEDRAAHHVGNSSMGNVPPNQQTIGIEVENLGTPDDPYPEAQLQAVAELSRDIIKRHPGIVLIPHRLIDRAGKIDPSYDWDDMVERVYRNKSRLVMTATSNNVYFVSPSGEYIKIEDSIYALKKGDEYDLWQKEIEEVSGLDVETNYKGHAVLVYKQV